MTLAAGSRLGPYEITAKLGEGGMGEVYRATDTKLRRDVAIKVLPQAFTEDRERLARFEREAQLLAQLNHPNIAAIHGLEESDGVRALVMELVDGPTLAERLESGALAIEESLAIARQIAEALEEAHEKGIIHRDLKPQNIKAPLDGKVKVLDFGLAKAMDLTAGSSAAASRVAQSPTLTMGATVQGMILGTAAYMAPEQAAGATVDRRADIWSFGVVLYEMLVGRRLFDGETVSHVLAGVLKDEPDYSLLPAEVPPKIRRLVRRCLRKKPRERLQAIGDARVVIDEVLAGADRDEPVAAPATAATAGPAMGRRTMVLGGLAGVAALAAGLAIGALGLAPRSRSAPPLRLQFALPEGLRLFETQGSPSVAMSRDGRRVVLAVSSEDGASGLLLRDLGELEPRRIEGTETARAPFFSPDGEWIGYFDEKNLLKVAVKGGKPIRLAAVDGRSRGGVWGDNGTIYFSTGTDSPIVRIAEAGGAVEPVTRLDSERNERTHRWPELTPDGRTLLFTCDTAASPTFYDDARIEAVDLASGERHVVVENASEARMLADDLLVYANGGNLFALPVDPRRLTARGKPVALEQEIATNVGSGAVQTAISRSGAAIWLPGARLVEVGTPIWYARDGKVTVSAVPGTVPIWQLALSPDGKRVALQGGGNVGGGSGRNDGGDANGNDLWLGDLERGTLARLTFDENIARPIFSADGAKVAYQRSVRKSGAAGERGDQEIAWKATDGSGDAKVLIRVPGTIHAPVTFSPDGRWLVYLLWDDKGKGDLWLLPLAPRGAPKPFQVSPFEEYAAAVSPDSRWIAYLSNETGRFEAYVRPFPEGPGKWQVSGEGAYEPRWSADGRELFFRSEDGRLWSVPVESGSTFRAGTPTALFGGLLGGRNPESYGVAPDGQRFLSLSLYSGASSVHALNYSDEWLTRARRLLAAHR